MRALQRLPDAQGIAAMQSVNAAVLTPSFLVVFTGTAAACVLLLATAPFTDQPGTAWRVVGALLHLVGVVAATAGRNVPLNTALDGVEPTSSEGARAVGALPDALDGVEPRADGGGDRGGHSPRPGAARMRPAG